MNTSPHAPSHQATLTAYEVAGILDGLSKSQVAVIGDFCLDVYWIIDEVKSEASLETGKRTRPVRQQRYAPGGAGNVVMNLLQLGVSRIYPIGVIGDDPFGHELLRQFHSHGITTEHLLMESGDWSTFTYVKPHTDGAENSRLDFGNFNQSHPTLEDRVIKQLENVLPKVSVVLVNHQVAGSLHDSERFRTALNRIIESNPETCFIIDSRTYHAAYPRAVHKLNDHEVMKASGSPWNGQTPVPLETLQDHAAQLSLEWQHTLVVTRGENGCLIQNGNSSYTVPGVHISGKVDTVGAGDSFVSAFAAILSSGVNRNAAAELANLAAAVTVAKPLQTGSASPEEILHLAQDAVYVHHPELAEWPGQANTCHGSELEIIRARPDSLEIRYAIFDHDGTISTLREGWEQVMEPMMIDAILGEKKANTSSEAIQKVRQRVLNFIDQTTGIQTIAQMHGLADLVKEFGYVETGMVRSPSEYKEIFNQSLLAMVRERVDKLDRGELQVDDFTMAGAVDFLKHLSDAGVTLYLASGTDHADVRREAERLGYAHYFQGRIFGSTGDIRQDAKKVVLEKILSQQDIRGQSVVAFGDGPVEIRETSRRGGYTVGIASDEKKNFGWNPDKRRRLIRSGADVVIPDFSRWAELAEYLHLIHPTQPNPTT
jgi:rfaE bifunctional protein kinase chain/domain